VARHVVRFREEVKAYHKQQYKRAKKVGTKTDYLRCIFVPACFFLQDWESGEMRLDRETVKSVADVSVEGISASGTQAETETRAGTAGCDSVILSPIGLI
jgi:hypothetical protein